MRTAQLLQFAAAAAAVFIASPATATQDDDFPVPYEAPQVLVNADREAGSRDLQTFTPNPRKEEPGTRLWGGPQFNARRQPEGALSRIIVYCSAGHGWTSDNEDIRPTDGDSTWYTQRGNYNNVVEDYGNIEQLNAFAQYIWNAGGTVVPFRPLGYQVNERVVDNDDPQVSYTGGWTTSTSTQFFGTAGDAAPYYFATSNATTETATARYTPNIPESGYYPVYCWALHGDNRVNQLYRIVHAGGSTEVRINHKRVGNGWVWLGNYYFDAGSFGYAEISNYAPGEGSNAVIADAIRFGNGMGDIDRGFGVSGYSRELEASRYWVQRSLGQGFPSSVYDLGSPNDDQNDNVGSPPRMAAVMNNASQGGFYERIFLSFHSNAGVSPNTYGLWNNSFPLAGQWAFAQAVNVEIVADMEALDSGVAFSPDYVTTRANGLIGSNYGEIRATYLEYEMTGTIAEVASHESVADGLVMRDPRARAAFGRSCYHAIMKFLDANATVPLTLAFLPEPPVNLRARNTGLGEVTLAWDPPAADPAGAEVPTGYVVYRSASGRDFGSPLTVAGGGSTTVTITGLTPGQVVYFQVAATNPGGESLPTETIAARVTNIGNAAPVLIVNGFDRFDVNLSPMASVPTNIISTSGGGSNFPLIRPLQMNAFNYVIQHALALEASGRFFDSCSNEALALGHVNPAGYQAIVWICGEESSVDQTLSAAERTVLSNWLGAGGGRGLFITGSEIGYELDGLGVASAFYESTLKANYSIDDTGTYAAAGAVGSIFASVVSLGFDPSAGSVYDANFPDRILPFDGTAMTCLNYVGGSGGSAAIQANVTSPGYKTVVFGFPFECITDATLRGTMMAQVMDYFAVPVPVAVSEFLVN